MIGLSQEAKIIAGVIDVSACAVGAGAIKNYSCIILGTTCANEVILKKMIVNLVYLELDMKDMH